METYSFVNVSFLFIKILQKDILINKKIYVLICCMYTLLRLFCKWALKMWSFVIENEIRVIWNSPKFLFHFHFMKDMKRKFLRLLKKKKNNSHISRYFKISNSICKRLCFLQWVKSPSSLFIFAILLRLNEPLQNVINSTSTGTCN